MDETVIKSIPKTPAIQDALKKPEQGQGRKQKTGKKRKEKKDPKRIIDTYA
ncbi:MAG: hypothetical protein GY806_20355 [Gammaproteobacteria bacterium]|nr:hypothetical protein [Gammaproteobacteria bacterium]